MLRLLKIKVPSQESCYQAPREANNTVRLFCDGAERLTILALQGLRFSVVHRAQTVSSVGRAIAQAG
jgi:hypothetical protein